MYRDVRDVKSSLLYIKRCKVVTNVCCFKKILVNCDGNMHLPILHLPRVELHSQEKLHHVTARALRTLCLSWEKLMQTVNSFITYIICFNSLQT